MCLEEIISIPTCTTENTYCMPQFDITDVLGFSLEKGAYINDTIEPKTSVFLKKKIKVAAAIIRNDIKEALGNQGYLANTLLGTFNTIKENKAACLNATGNGVKIKIQKKHRCLGMRKMRISSICARIKSVNGQTSGTTNIQIYDGAGITYTIPIKFNDGQLICSMACDSNGNPITIMGEGAIITYADNNVIAYSSEPACGSCTSKCVDIYGFSNGYENTNENYGLDIRGECYCDIDFLICSISRETAGLLMLYKLGSLLALEAEFSQRSNYKVIAQKNEQGYLIDANKKMYDNLLKTTVSGWDGFLKTFNGDGCIDCNLTKLAWQI